MKLSFLSSHKLGGPKKPCQVIPAILFKTLRRNSATKRTELSEEHVEYLVKHLNMEKALIEEQYQLFLSNHPDGTISKKCFHTMFANCRPGGNLKKMSKHIWRIFDTNQDGVIDFREFIMVLYIMNNGTLESNLKQIFRVFDIDNNGTINVKEVKKVMKDLSKLENGNSENSKKDDLAHSVFKEMDENEDGEISEEEFIKACLGKKKFSKLIALKIIKIFIEA